MTHALSGETGSHAVERLARDHPGLVSIARLGWVAKGVVYILLGVLAVPIALEGAGTDDGAAGGDQASQTGAVAHVAESSPGVLALWLIAFGLLLYVVWRLISIVLPADNSAKSWATRVGYAISGIVYATVAWVAISFASSGGAQSSSQAGTEDSTVERYSRDLMEKSGGRWLVGAVGVAVVAVGLFFLIRGITANFRKELEPRGVGPISHESIVTLGRIGWVGRGLMMGLVGWFVIRAAVQFRPDQAKGFDGALRETTGSTAGSWLVGFVAVAMIVYGAYCVISAPRERLRGAD